LPSKYSRFEKKFQSRWSAKASAARSPYIGTADGSPHAWHTTCLW
jgi:hypothetical protein